MKKIILISISILIIAAGIWGYITYNNIYKPNVNLGDEEFTYLYIPTGSNFDNLIQIFEKKQILKDIGDFKTVAKLKKFKNVKAGRYKLVNNMSTNALINMLRIGDQEPVDLKFNNSRNLAMLAGEMTKSLELDSADLAQYILSADTQKKYGFDSKTFISMFLPNTYEVFWNISAENLVKHMATVYKEFWNKSRRNKAKELGMSQSEIATLASIVQTESYKSDEQDVVAGAYINRLKIGMPLQADPTVIFAGGDFSVKRVTGKLLQIDSPYNTYKYKGLPPGPIFLTSETVLDAVLNYEKHDYIYFCAKEDFSGYHVFAENYDEHMKNANRYQQALNQRKIFE